MELSSYIKGKGVDVSMVKHLDNAVHYSPEIDNFYSLKCKFKPESGNKQPATVFFSLPVFDGTASFPFLSFCLYSPYSLLESPCIYLLNNNFEFVILNNGSTTLNDVSWQFDTDDSNRINSTSNISSLAVGEKAFVYAQYNFSSSGNYNVRANATGISQSTVVSSSLSSSITTNDVAITSFSSLNRDGTNAIFEIQAINNMADNLTNLNWSLAAGDGAAINSAGHFAPVQSNETIFIFVIVWKAR